MTMTKKEAIQELQNCIGLIQQDGQDYLDERDIPLLNMAIEALSERTGEWIDVNGDGSLWRCDQCKDTACCKGNFCPNCGARMTPCKGGDLE